MNDDIARPLPLVLSMPMPVTTVESTPPMLLPQTNKTDMYNGCVRTWWSQRYELSKLVRSTQMLALRRKKTTDDVALFNLHSEIQMKADAMSTAWRVVENVWSKQDVNMAIDGGKEFRLRWDVLPPSHQVFEIGCGAPQEQYELAYSYLAFETLCINLLMLASQQQCATVVETLWRTAEIPEYHAALCQTWLNHAHTMLDTIICASLILLPSALSRVDSVFLKRDFYTDYVKALIVQQAHYMAAVTAWGENNDPLAAVAYFELSAQALDFACSTPFVFAQAERERTVMCFRRASAFALLAQVFFDQDDDADSYTVVYQGQPPKVPGSLLQEAYHCLRLAKHLRLSSAQIAESFANLRAELVSRYDALLPEETGPLSIDMSRLPIRIFISEQIPAHVVNCTHARPVSSVVSVGGMERGYVIPNAE